MNPNVIGAVIGDHYQAGVTVYAPLKRYKTGRGKRVGVIGIGGLVHLAVQIASKMGAQVTAFGTSMAKRDLAMKLGASDYINVNDDKAMSGIRGTLDIILCTSDLKGQSFDKYFQLATLDAYFVMLAIPDEPMSIPAITLCMTRVCVSCWITERDERDARILCQQ